jgi:hypothetical protein
MITHKSNGVSFHGTEDAGAVFVSPLPELFISLALKFCILNERLFLIFVADLKAVSGIHKMFIHYQGSTQGA